MAKSSSQNCSSITRKLKLVRQLAGTALLAWSLLALSACATARFKTFAQMGIAYVDAADAVLAEAGALVVDEDSENLILARDGLTQEQRERQILTFNDQDRRHLTTLNDIRRHGRLLRDYFVALSALAESDAPAQISKSAENLYASLQKLHPKIESATVFDKPIKPLIAPAIKLTFAHFQRAALERELKRRAKDIERELALQHAAMKAVTEGMRARLEHSLLPGQESALVVLPYVDKQDPPQMPPKNKLPNTWKADRRKILTSQASIESVTAAAKAADKLRTSFARLVGNEFDHSDSQSMLQDLNEVLTIVQILKVGTKKE